MLAARISLLLALVFTVALAGHAAAQSIDATPVRVLVVKATWGPQPFTSDDVDVAMQAVEQFYATASYGKVALSYEQSPWLAMSEQPACTTVPERRMLAPELTAIASNAGYRVTAYDRVVFVFPDAGCGFLGFTNPDGIVLNGSFAAGLVTHELGHSFGMGHASAFECRYTPSSRRFCSASVYGDIWDVMGSSWDTATPNQAVGDFGALQKARAGWLVNYRRVTRDGIYRLAALEQPTTLPQALVISSGGFQYWIDHRQPVGNDSYLAHDTTAYVTTGFEVHRVIGNPLAAPPTTIVPDYLMPRGKANLQYTPPGATFTEAGAFSLTAISRIAGTMTIRFRRLHP